MNVKNNKPMMKGFANVGAVFGEKPQDGNVIHPQLIKMARKSGSLNLSNRSMDISEWNV